MRDAKENFTLGEISTKQGQIEHFKTHKTWKTQRSKFLWNFWVLRCSVQIEVKRIILLKSSLLEVSFIPREVRFMSHLSDSSVVNILIGGGEQPEPKLLCSPAKLWTTLNVLLIADRPLIFWIPILGPFVDFVSILATWSWLERS